jgi:thioredoxin-like negative regulator of GroEL
LCNKKLKKMFDNLDKKTLMYIGIGVVVFIILAYTIYYFTREKYSESDCIFRMFYVDWCGYCKQAKPQFEPMIGTAKINNRPVKIVMVNADEQPQLAQQFGVRGFPTFVLTKSNGESINYDGQRLQPAFRAFLEENVQ